MEKNEARLYAAEPREAIAQALMLLERLVVAVEKAVERLSQEDK